MGRRSKPSPAMEWLEYAGYLAFVHWPYNNLPWRAGAAGAGWIARNIAAKLGFMKRAEQALQERRPNYSAQERAQIKRQSVENFARVAVEYERLPEVAANAAHFEVEGLEHFEAAKAQAGGRMVITSAHFGNWEAIRCVAALHGAPLGLVYRPFNNAKVDAVWHTLITATGWPAFRKGAQGMRALYKHLAQEGGAMILVDQRAGGAPLLKFMGADAETSLAAADLARRLKIPLLTAAAFRTKDGFKVRFEPQIEQTSSEEMMQTVNNRIEAWIDEDPGQWFWFHRRWRIRKSKKGVRKGSGR